MKLQVSIIGAQKLAQALKRSEALASKACDAGLYNVGLAIAPKAIRHAPKKWGVLRGSCHVTLPENGSVTVGFGGPAEAYALVQHRGYRRAGGDDSASGVVFFRNYTTPGTGPHFLKKAIDEVAPKATDIFLRVVKAVLEKGQAPVLRGGNIPTTPDEGPKAPAAGGRRRRRRS